MTLAPSEAGPAPNDRALVAAQLGREPRGRWRVGTRCVWGAPSTIVTEPLLDDGSPFPTLQWLTCPWLAERAASEESAGGADAWSTRLAEDAGLAARLRVADEAYRCARADLAGGADPCAGVGIAGQRDPLGVKCLHAHVAAALAGTGDPVGEALVSAWGTSCDDGRRLCGIGVRIDRG